MMGTLVSLGIIFTQLSLLAFGGGASILPEMQRQVVDVHGWMSAADFGALYALAQAAPGPNLMVVPLIGWHVAGLAGVVVTSIAKFIPSSVLMGVVLGLWERFKDRPWRARVQAGLVPVTVGLVLASAWLITLSVVHNAAMALITVAVAALSVFTRLHPLWMLLGGAVVGLAYGYIA